MAAIPNRLESVPAIELPEHLQFLGPLIRSMLESDEFENAINEFAHYVHKLILNDNVPAKVYVVPSKTLDGKTKMFGLFNPELRHEGEDNYVISLSHNFSEYLRHYRNHQMILLACITIMHEMAHVLMRTALDFESTPAQFTSHHAVPDFGHFVERRMFEQLFLLGDGLELLIEGRRRRRWITPRGRYDSTFIGCKQSRTRLTDAYIARTVTTAEWHAPTGNDVVRVPRKQKTSAVFRVANSGDSEFVNIRGQCGIVVKRLSYSTDDDEDAQTNARAAADKRE